MCQRCSAIERNNNNKDCERPRSINKALTMICTRNSVLHFFLPRRATVDHTQNCKWRKTNVGRFLSENKYHDRHCLFVTGYSVL